MSEPTGARRYGVGGGDAYYDAVKYGGYEGTREQFGRDQAEFAQNAAAVAEAKETVERDTEEVRNTKNTFENTTVPEAIRALNQEGDDQILAITQKGEEVSQQVETVGTEQKDAVANEGRARVQAVEQAGTTQAQAVNDAGTTQVGNVNQAGEDQVDAVEQAGTDQVQAVTDEGDIQVQKVQDKGNEVLESIPSDYTTLSQKVDTLKGSLTEADYYYFDYSLYDGYIATDGQIVDPTAKKEKYTSLIEIPSDKKIGYALNYPEPQYVWFGYALYTENEEFINRTILISSENYNHINSILTVSNDSAKYIRFTFRGYDDYNFILYNPISNKVDEITLNTNKIINNIGEYTGSFEVRSGVSHSWTADIIEINVKAGDTFIVNCKSSVITGAQIYVSYNDGTYERIYSSNQLYQTFTATKDINGIGLYIASQFISGDGICEINVSIYGSALTLTGVTANYCANIKSINHRGFGTAPENTLPAYKLSRKMGFTHVETDILWTSDNVAVLLHDTTINRTARNADGSTISSTIRIDEITYEQALTYDFGIYKGANYAGTKIATFEDFIILCKQIGLHPYIELKSGSQEQINGLVNAVKRYGMVDNVTWISFEITFLGRVKTANTSARLGYIVNTIDATKISEAVALKNTSNEVFIDTNYTHVTAEIIESCINADMPLEVYTVDVPDAVINLDAYISGYTSNYLVSSKIILDHHIDT